MIGYIHKIVAIWEFYFPDLHGDNGHLVVCAYLEGHWEQSGWTMGNPNARIEFFMAHFRLVPWRFNGKGPRKISNEKNIQREKGSSAIVSIRRSDNIQYLLQVEYSFSLLSIFWITLICREWIFWFFEIFFEEFFILKNKLPDFCQISFFNHRNSIPGQLEVKWVTGFLYSFRQNWMMAMVFCGTEIFMERIGRS